MAGRSEAGRRGLALVLLGALLAGCQASSTSNRFSPPPGVTDAPRPAASPAPTTDLPVARPAGGAQAPEAGFTQLSPVPLGTAAAAFSLKSPAFGSGGPLPSEFSCDGAGQSPPLAWSGAPAGTRAYALVAEDVDALMTEWVAYNMPLGVTQLDAGLGTRPLLPNGTQQGVNSRGTVGYDPVCPNRGDPAHHYVFSLSAVDDYITMQTGASAGEVKVALNGHVLAAAQLMATFQR